MTEAESVMIDLLRVSLSGAPFENSHSSVDWDAVRENAELQAVEGLIAKLVPPEAGQEWKDIAKQQRLLFTHYLVAQRELVSAFGKAGIPMAILKGCAVAKYYPVPECRIMGDIDFIVPEERFREAYALMRRCGYTGKPNISVQNGEQRRHVGFHKDLFDYELHHHFSYRDLDIESYISEGLAHIENSQVYSYTFPTLPRLANGMVLLAHMRDHLKSGLGLRQVIDWMMYVNGELDDAFWENEFRDAAASVGLDTLAKTATRMCQIYFGFSEQFTWCADIDADLCRRLLELLLGSGNFGIKHGAGSSIEAVSTKFRKNGFLRQLQLSGERNWKAYHRHPRLRLFCWAYQFGRYCYRGLSTGRGINILRDASRSKERYELMKELNIADPE